MSTLIETGGASRAPRIVAASVCGLVLSTAAIALRSWSRRIVHRSLFWWDDYLAVLGWALGVGECALSLYWVHIGLGRHQTDVKATPDAQLRLPLFVQNIIYNLGITAVKLSLLCFYARVFRDRGALRVGLWITAALAVVWYVAATIVSICTCLPVRAQWDHLQNRTCIDHNKTFLGTATSNFLIDFIILLLPMPAVWALQMSMSRRIGVIFIFSLGVCFMIISIVRVVAVVHYQVQDQRLDFTWNWVPPQELLIVEIPLGVVGICLPAVLLLARRAYNHGWRAVASAGRTKQYHADTASPPHTRLEDLQSGGGGRDGDSSRQLSNDSYAQFIASLGRGSRAETQTHASRDPPDDAAAAAAKHMAGREEIQVRVSIEVDIDCAPLRRPLPEHEEA